MVIQAFLKKNWVVLEQTDDDKRSKYVSLTNYGESIASDIIKSFGEAGSNAFAAQMMNLATMADANFNMLLSTCIKMLTASAISGVSMLIGSYICSDLTSRVGTDMRNALYKKSMTLSVSDFLSFGTASVTTRTVSDITNIQFALGTCFQMHFPVLWNAVTE